ncbi:MAG: hypothetical protein AB2693_32060 [Candidatus Thiodiazotropha sp.]
MVHKIFWVQEGDLEIEAKVTKVKSGSELVQLVFPCTFGDILAIRSKNEVKIIKI